MDAVSRPEAEAPPSDVNWGALIWPSGPSTGNSQVIADRAAAAAAIAARAGSESASTAGGSVAVQTRDLSSFTTAASAAATRARPVMVRTGLAALPEITPELEPWNPEATYESLVRLLAELKAMHPQEVAVLPSRPRGLGVRRRTKVVAAVAAAAVVLGAGAVFFRHQVAGHRPVVAAAPHMSTVLVALESGSNSLVGANLIASEGSKTQEILLPGGLLVDVPGQGSVTLAQSPASGPTAAAAAIENALQVRIDSTWTLTPATIAALVNAEGGVDVTLTADILPTDGSANIGIGAGNSHLNGAQAAALAQALGATEPEVSRLARQQILLAAILTKLPANPTQLAALIPADQLNGTLTPASLATVLESVRSTVVNGSAGSTVIPTQTIDSGSGTPAYGLDEDATATLVANSLAPAQLPVPAGGRAHVLVQNGVGTPGLGDDARAQLVARGYIFRTGGNTTSFGTGPSVVLIPDATAPSRALGSRIAQLLGLPATAVQLDSNPTTVADAVVILGSDYKPPVSASATPATSSTSAPATP
jgi:hypothetical protein